jgi:hypothetical protein
LTKTSREKTHRTDISARRNDDRAFPGAVSHAAIALRSGRRHLENIGCVLNARFGPFSHRPMGLEIKEDKLRAGFLDHLRDTAAVRVEGRLLSKRRRGLWSPAENYHARSGAFHPRSDVATRLRDAAHAIWDRGHDGPTSANAIVLRSNAGSHCDHGSSHRANAAAQLAHLLPVSTPDTPATEYPARGDRNVALNVAHPARDVRHWTAIRAHDPEPTGTLLWLAPTLHTPRHNALSKFGHAAHN